MPTMPLDSRSEIDCIRNPLEIAERVWWVGHVQADDPFQCHVYLIEQGEQSVLIDPGSRLTFQHTLRKIESIIPFAFIRYFICHHQDPDITGALPIIDDIVSRDDALLVTHWRARPRLDQALCPKAALNVRSGDLPVRLGGEEFALFVIGQPLDKMRLLAERLRSQVAVLHFAVPMAGRKVTLSVGLALRRQQESLADFIQRADMALYVAKRAGRDRLQVAS